MARIREAAAVLLAVGMLAVVFGLTYEAGTNHRGSGPPVVDVRD